MDPAMLAMMQYLVGSGIDPQMIQMLFGTVMPEMTTSGEIAPFDATNQQKGLNLAQDYAGGMADNMFAALGGGAWGNAPTGGGVIGGGGLNPITTETILDTPLTNSLSFQARNPTTYEGFVAKQLLGDPDNGIQPLPASVIFADLKGKIEDAQDPKSLGKLTGVDPNMMAMIAQGLPTMPEIDPTTGNQTGRTVIDWEKARQDIAKTASDYAGEAGMLAGPNISRNTYGQYVSLSEEPSPTMKWLTERGFPDPRAQYGVDFMMQNEPELQGILTQMAAKGQAYEAQRNAYEAYLKKNPVAQHLAGLAEQGAQQRQSDIMRRIGEYQQQMNEYNRNQPADPMAGGGLSSTSMIPNVLNAIPGTNGAAAQGADIFADAITPGAGSPLGAIGAAADAVAGGIANKAGGIARGVGALGGLFDRATNAVTPGPMGAGQGAEILTNVVTPGPVSPTQGLEAAIELAGGNRGTDRRPTLDLPAKSFAERFYGGIRPGTHEDQMKLYRNQALARRAYLDDPMWGDVARSVGQQWARSKAGQTPFGDVVNQRLAAIRMMMGV